MVVKDAPEFKFVVRPTANNELCFGISLPIAERQIQPRGRDIDKIAVIVFHAAVVVTRKNQPVAPRHDHLARGVNRLDPGQAARIEKKPPADIHDPVNQVGPPPAEGPPP